MAGGLICITLIHLLLVSDTINYSIHGRVHSKLDDRRLLPKLSVVHSPAILDGCPSVQTSRARQCEFLPRDFRYYDLFQAICEQHQLCYACGSVHGISERKCNTLSRIHMYEQCSKNPWTETDCLRRRPSALLSLAEDIYRPSRFASECHDDCILDYLFSNPNIE